MKAIHNPQMKRHRYFPLPVKLATVTGYRNPLCSVTFVSNHSRVIDIKISALFHSVSLS